MKLRFRYQKLSLHRYRGSKIVHYGLSRGGIRL